jgi:DNA-binding Lrp family transcriptional regulator
MGRGYELANTLEWVLGVLEHRAYLDGTRYYETAECFLFFSARLLHKVRDEGALHARFAQLLRERVLEREGCAGDALALAMRVIVGAAVGLRLERDLATLLPLQYEDGGWGPSWIYKYGSSGLKIGNRGLTTALALNAIAALYPPAQPQPQPQPQPQTQPQQGKKQKQELESELQLEKEEEKEKKLLIGQSFCTVEITPLPLPQLPVSSVIHGSITTGLSSSPSLPLPQMRRRTRKTTLSMTAFVKGVFTFLFSRSASPLPRQAV